MPKGKGSNVANSASINALNQANALTGASQATAASLLPEVEAQAAAPPGYSPVDEAAMLTRAEQGAGGTQAAGVGQGALLESRTNNPGAARAAIAASSRGAGEELGRRGLDIQTANAEEKARQQQAALSELGGLYGTQLSTANQAFGEVPGNVNANTNASANNFNQMFDWAKLAGQNLGYSNGGFTI